MDLVNISYIPLIFGSGIPSRNLIPGKFQKIFQHFFEKFFQVFLRTFFQRFFQGILQVILRIFLGYLSYIFSRIQILQKFVFFHEFIAYLLFKTTPQMLLGIYLEISPDIYFIKFLWKCPLIFHGILTEASPLVCLNIPPAIFSEIHLAQKYHWETLQEFVKSILPGIMEKFLNKIHARFFFKKY